MADRATVSQIAQIGVETTPGTGVAATKLLQATDIQMGVKPDIKLFRPTGNKYNTASAIGKEWTEGKLSGQMVYTEDIYWLSSILSQVTPTRLVPTTGLCYQWLFQPSSTAADTVKTFTLEQGDASVRAHKSPGMIVKELGYKFTREKIERSGAFFAQLLSDAITLSGSTAAIPLVPVVGNQVNVFLASSYAGLTGATALTRPLEVEWKLGNRFGPIWALNTSQTSYGGTVELVPKGEVKLLLEADSAGMALLTDMRANTLKFLRIQATGAQIDAGGTPNNYLFQFDNALRISNVSEFKDKDGVYAIEWTFEFAHDSTWGYSTNVTVQNTISAL